MSEKKPKYRKVHLLLEEEVFKGIWDIVKERYVSPIRKFHLVVNEALKEYIERHREARESA